MKLSCANWKLQNCIPILKLCSHFAHSWNTLYAKTCFHYRYMQSLVCLYQIMELLFHSCEYSWGNVFNVEFVFEVRDTTSKFFVVKLAKRMVLYPALNPKKLGCRTVNPKYESYNTLLTRHAIDKSVLILQNRAAQFQYQFCTF